MSSYDNDPDTIKRLQNLNWFNKMRDILYDGENPVNDCERDKTLEEIYQLTLREFQK